MVRYKGKRVQVELDDDIVFHIVMWSALIVIAALLVVAGIWIEPVGG